MTNNIRHPSVLVQVGISKRAKLMILAETVKQTFQLIPMLCKLLLGPFP